MTTLQDVSVNIVYLMGGCFLLGSLATILSLLMLDFMRRNKEPGAK